VISASDLRKIARARLVDAQALYRTRRYDGSIYLCGYAVELSLKYRICKTLGWNDFPSTSGEFKAYQTFRTHDLDVLLHLSGREARIKKQTFAEWSTVAEWDPEVRYRSIGSASKPDAELMINAAAAILRIL
jgi:HEPN domain-containing protein